MPPQKSALKRDSELSRDSDQPLESPKTPGAFRIAMTGNREKLESTLDKWHDDDLSIVASDDEGSTDGHSLASPGTAPKSPKTAPIDLVQNETKAVRFLRFVLLTCLVGAAIFFCTGTFRWVEKAELYDALASTDSNESATDWVSDTILEAYAEALEKNLRLAQESRNMAAFTLSASFTSHALSSSTAALETWPHVTIPHLETRLTGLLETLASTQVRLAPIVTSDTRTSFEEYAVEQQLDECSSCPTVSQIYNANGEIPPRTETTFPIWQVAPYTTETFLMMNLNSIENDATAIRQMQALGAGVLSDFRDDTQLRLAPQIALFYPVFAEFQQINLATAISIEFNLHELLNNSVPFDLMGRNDFSIFVESCSGQIVSFISGESGTELIYAGSLATFPDSLKEKAITFQIDGAYRYGEISTPISSTDDVCNYLVRVLPTSVVDEVLDTAPQQQNITDSKRHIVLTIVSAAIFLVLLAVFLIFDWMVEKRQEVVVNIATKSSAIVENLFPAQVRDRMLQNMLHKDQNGNNAAAGDTAAANAGDNTNSSGGDQISRNVIPAASGGAPSQVSVKQFLTNEPGNVNDLSSQPIADLFPNTVSLKCSHKIVQVPPNSANTLFFFPPTARLFYLLILRVSPHGPVRESHHKCLPSWKRSTGVLMSLQRNSECSRSKLLEIVTWL